MHPLVLEKKTDEQPSKTQLYKNKVKIAIATEAKNIYRYKNMKGNYSTARQTFSLTYYVTTMLSPQTIQI
jgi:hypothetical protein